MTLQAHADLRTAGTSRFRDRLLAVMDKKDHPSYWRLMGPGATRSQLLAHYVQEWAVYVRDFPQYLSRVHARCPEAEVRHDLAENLFEEETGKISGGGPHGELFLLMMEGLGFSRQAFDRATLLPASAAYRRFLDRATLREPWWVGLAIATIFVEGSRNERAEIGLGEAKEAGHPDTEGRARGPQRSGISDASADGRPGASRLGNPRVEGDAKTITDPIASDPLVVNHGLHPRFLELKRVHRKVEGSHRISAWRCVLAYARTREQRAQVEAAMERALTLWLAYRDGVAKAARLG